MSGLRVELAGARVCLAGFRTVKSLTAGQVCGGDWAKPGWPWRCGTPPYSECFNPARQVLLYVKFRWYLLVYTNQFILASGTSNSIPMGPERRPTRGLRIGCNFRTAQSSSRANAFTRKHCNGLARLTGYMLESGRGLFAAHGCQACSSNPLSAACFPLTSATTSSWIKVAIPLACHNLQSTRV